MHVRAIAPIHLDEMEFARRCERYDMLAPGGIRITLANLPNASDVPNQLATSDDIAASDSAVAAVLRGLDPGEVDVGLPDCVLDPGISAAGDTEVRVLGITRLAAGLLDSLGEPFTAVARNRAIADELDGVITRYGYSGFNPTRVLDLSFEAVSDHRLWNDALIGLRENLAGTDIRRVLNGCSAVEVSMSNDIVAVFDPTRLALDAIRVALEHGLVGLERRADG